MNLRNMRKYHAHYYLIAICIVWRESSIESQKLQKLNLNPIIIDPKPSVMTESGINWSITFFMNYFHVEQKKVKSGPEQMGFKNVVRVWET